MSAQSEIRSTSETKERSDAINRMMLKYGEENHELTKHVAKLQGITRVLVLAIVAGVSSGVWWVMHQPKEVCEQQSYVQPQPTHKKGGLEYTLRP